ncbi:MAG TPA: amidohydrolase family protein [Acidimicrobiales bacterium]|nr:amidohydrolase family protein [Acidimicrobiales bacterium]
MSKIKGDFVRTIALEEHVLPRDIAIAAGKEGLPPSLADALDDMGQERIDLMDAAGIDLQVLSLVAHELQELESTESIALARVANDRMAGAIRTNPDRFRAFATLPMSDPDAAAAELQRTVHELGFVGAMIFGQTNGVFLDDPSVSPVLEAAEDLDVPIYLHPAEPPLEVRRAYFSGLAPAVAQMLATAGWGWHAECGLHILRMAVNGTFERHPRLRVIVGHMGENLPFSLARADERLSRLTGLERTVAETIVEQVHITTAAYFTDPPLLCALMVFGADRILFSVDHPFSDSMEAVAFLRDAPLSPSDREKIAHANAEKLLKL